MVQQHELESFMRVYICFYGAWFNPQEYKERIQKDKEKVRKSILYICII